MRTVALFAGLSLVFACSDRTPSQSRRSPMPTHVGGGTPTLLAEPVKRSINARRGVADAPGRLSLLLTDAPPDANITAVNICFDHVDVQFTGGAAPQTIIDSPGTFDLLGLQNGVTVALGNVELPSGIIDQIRVVVCDAGSTVVVGGEEEPLRIPSGTESGIKLTKPGGFEIRDNLTTTVIVDFDARSSLHFTNGNGWELRPVIKLIEAVALSITSPLAGEFVPRQPFPVTGTFSSRAQDPVVSITVNGTPASLGAGIFSASARTPTDAPNQTVLVVATTEQGLQDAVDISVAVDSVLPLAAITSPHSGSIEPNAFTVTVDASDDVGVDHVELLIDGAPVESSSTTPYEFSVDGAALSPGPHALEADAIDFSGNRGVSAPVTILVSRVSASLSSVTADPLSLAADGNSATLLTVRLVDDLGHPVAGVSPESITLAASGSGNVLVQAATPTDSNGATGGTLSSTTAELKRVTATILVGDTSVSVQSPLIAFVPPSSQCGNGVVDPGEACDDGNTLSGDGCRSDCRGAVSDDTGLGDYAQVSVIPTTSRDFVFSCLTCTGVIDVVGHELPNVLRLDMRDPAPATTITASSPDGLTATLTRPAAMSPGSYRALAFDYVVALPDGGQATGGFFLFLHAQPSGAPESLEWPDFACRTGATPCAHAAGRLTKMFLSNVVAP